MLDKHRRDLGINARAIDNGEILQRLVYALVNEGARLLEEGIAARASDIDVVYLTGYGFPRWRGGPDVLCRLARPLQRCARMKRFARNPHDDATFWQPAPLLEQACCRRPHLQLARKGAGP